jgi:hypothetical protein
MIFGGATDGAFESTPVEAAKEMDSTIQKAITNKQT